VQSLSVPDIQIIAGAALATVRNRASLSRIRPARVALPLGPPPTPVQPHQPHDQPGFGQRRESRRRSKPPRLPEKRR
jgi:hypothetical protein